MFIINPHYLQGLEPVWVIINPHSLQGLAKRAADEGNNEIDVGRMIASEEFRLSDSYFVNKNGSYYNYSGYNSWEPIKR